MVSRLKINLAKSELVLVGDVKGLARIIGCKVESLLMKYLVFFWELLTSLILFGMTLLKK